MGKHYVPQQYLRGFEDPTRPEWIWMYDKLRASCKQLPIKRVAQEEGFFTEDVERDLTELVEKPANAVLSRLWRGETIDSFDRARLAYYIATMMRRVPGARARAYQNVPQALGDSVRRVRELLEAEARAGRLDPQSLHAQLAKLPAIEEVMRESPPPEVVGLIESPWPFESMVAAIFAMTWRLLAAEGPSYFLTSDNPAHFFEAYGLGTSNAELVFPICKDLGLHGCWESGTDLEMLDPSQNLVKVFNRRIASGADRFVFYHRQESWVLSVAGNLPTQLNRIRWRY